MSNVGGSLLCCAAAVLLAGCATIVTSSTRTEHATRTAKPADRPIEMFEGTPGRPHKVIGTVQARVKLSEETRLVAPRERIVESLKAEARALGGDALIGLRVAPATGGGSYFSPTGHVLVGNSEIWSAMVVVWLDQ